MLTIIVYSLPHRAMYGGMHRKDYKHARSFPMPMIDVYARADLFPAGTDRQLGEELTAAVLRAEGVAHPGPLHLDNTALSIHRMDPATVHTASTGAARTVPVHVITEIGQKAPVF